MDEVSSAVVLAGGQGLRLRPLTVDNPKAMIEVAGKPLLQWILEGLKSNGVRNVTIGVAYKKEKIMKYFGDGRKFGLNITYSVHTLEGGTGEGFRLAIQRHVRDDLFLAMNGDELVDFSLRDFAAFHISEGGTATIAVGPLRSPFGVVQINGSNVIGFEEKPILRSHFVSIGTYIFSREILQFLPDRGDVERTTFKKLAATGKLKAYIHSGFWATINTIKDLEDVETQLKEKSG